MSLSIRAAKMGSIPRWLLTVLFLGIASCSTVPRELAAPRRTHAEVRVGTYNVFIGSHDLRQTSAVIRRMNAGVVVLQEVDAPNAAALGHEFSQDYPHRYFSNGLGIMSRYPMRNPRFLRSRRGLNGFLFAEIDHPQGRLQVVNMHLDPLRIWTMREKLALPIQVWRRQGDIHRDELAQVFENLRPGRPTILLGDFNRAGNAAIDWLREAGFIDSFAAATRRPDWTPTLHYSLLGFRSGRRVDFIFHDRTFNTVGSQVFSGQPSDHDAVVSVLRWE